MCKVDGGSFVMSKKAAAAAGLTGKVSLKSFYIDQFEVTAAQFARFLNVHGNDCPGRNAPTPPICARIVHGNDGNGQRLIMEDGGKFRPVLGTEDRAATVSLEAALRYCTWAGKALASEAQWEYAARHDPRTGRDLKYPWGDRFEANRSWVVNYKEPLQPGDALPAGTFDGTNGHLDGSSPWGVHDLAGNGYEQVVRCPTPDVAGDANSDCPTLGRGVVDGVQFDVTMRSDEQGPDGLDEDGTFRCTRAAL